MKKIPIIIKKILNKTAQESGCCFTSCGGSPVMQKSDDKKETITMKLLKKIK